jgi:hypothetical protein
MPIEGEVRLAVRNPDIVREPERNIDPRYGMIGYG